MTTETVKIIKLTASEGMTLTNGVAFGKTIYLGDNDRTENWHEITDAQAAELQRTDELEEE